jgi:hypothetical protein
MVFMQCNRAGIEVSVGRSRSKRVEAHARDSRHGRAAVQRESPTNSSSMVERPFFDESTGCSSGEADSASYAAIPNTKLSTNARMTEL